MTHEGAKTPLAILSLTALGVVFGDIGTSPLYAFREAFLHEGVAPAHRVAATVANVYGVLSLIFWSLVLVVSIKYLAFVLRADNRGEGGILALMALAHRDEGGKRRRRVVVLLGLFGAALLYGDGMITPAISVLSAVEGISVVTPTFEPYVIPITVGLLLALFLVQRHGTASVGAVFGPVMVVWFGVLAALGVRGILENPDVLFALDPRHAVRFFLANGAQGFFVLGAVFLAVTGGEALYADMGHFGARPIRLAWFLLVFPSLLLNYFGQGALVLSDPALAANPFYLLAPRWALAPLVVLATAATIIASQALITGAYSLAMQAIHLGYSPRLRIEHTSALERGQVYIPFINIVLMVACVALVLEFRTSSALAAAYGIAVTLLMMLTSMLFMIAARDAWGWSRTVTALVGGTFLVVDVAFFLANVPKIPHGGWFPLVVAAVGFALMTSWWRGRKVLGERLKETIVPLQPWIASVRAQAITRVSGTAVYLTGNPHATPPALLRVVNHTKVLHKKVLLLTILPEEVARVPEKDRIEYKELSFGFHRAYAHYGFMEEPHVPEIMARLKERGFDHDPEDTTYFLGRERIVTEHGSQGMALWRAKLFAFMAQNSQPVPSYFRIPPERVVEVGAQIKP